MFKSKFFIPSIVAAAVLLVGGAVAVAGYINLEIFFTHPGFLRGHSNSGAPSSETFRYGYGYGYGHGWGYGYGYGNAASSLYLEQYPYGFFGEDGAPTVDDVTVTRTTLTVEFTTSYKTDQVLLMTEVDHATEMDDTIGTRSLEVTGLTCGTIYEYELIAKDIHGNEWSTSDDFMTSACASTGGGGGGSVGGSTSPTPRPVTPITKPTTTPTKDTPPSGNGQKAATFPLTLKVPAFGDAVLDLQKFLNEHGYPVSKTGKGSKGNESKYFGPKTKKALIKFQLANNLKPDGILGPKTKAVMLKMLSGK